MTQRYRLVTVIRMSWRAWRGLLTSLLALVVVGQVAAVCPTPPPTTAHGVDIPGQSHYCGNPGTGGEAGAAVESRRSAGGHDLHVPGLVVPVPPPTAATAGRRPLRPGGRRAPPEGRTLLQRLCISRT